jgi:hypothetical protein
MKKELPFRQAGAVRGLDMVPIRDSDFVHRRGIGQKRSVTSRIWIAGVGEEAEIDLQKHFSSQQ